MTTRTYTPRASEIERRWFVVDANGETPGPPRHAGRDAAGGQAQAHVCHPHGHRRSRHRGQRRARSTVTGDKLPTKSYARHSGYPGGFREETLGDLLARRPEEVIRRAVKGMLPHNKLGVQQLRKLKVYAGREHPHEAQQPSRCR